MPMADDPSEEGPRGAEPLIRLAGARLGYPRRPILEGVDLSIAAGSYLGIVGPNGAGKTTLVATLIGRLRPLAGRLERRPGLRLGYVPQRQALDPIWPLCVRDIVAMGRLGARGALGRLGDEDRAICTRALADLGLAGAEDRLFRELSGGQQQRAILARALATEPDLLILDEPTSQLDVAGSVETLALATRLHSERGVGVVLVTHDLGAVVEHATHVALVARGQVRVGEAASVLRDDVLSDLFGVALEVVEVGGRRAVLPGLPGRARGGAP